jgi:hypothetical protein
LFSIAFFWRGWGVGGCWKGSVGVLWEWCLILHLLVIFRTPWPKLGLKWPLLLTIYRRVRMLALAGIVHFLVMTMTKQA